VNQNANTQQQNQKNVVQSRTATPNTQQRNTAAPATESISEILERIRKIEMHLNKEYNKVRDLEAEMANVKDCMIKTQLTMNEAVKQLTEAVRILLPQVRPASMMKDVPVDANDPVPGKAVDWSQVPIFHPPQRH